MSPQALHLSPADIPEGIEFLIFSPEHGLISEHGCEDEARAALTAFLADFDLADLPLLLKRNGDDWEFTEM